MKQINSWLPITAIHLITMPCLVLSVLILNGCVAKFKHELKFDPREPLRVAVLPFRQIDEAGKSIMPRKEDLLIDNLEILSSQLAATPAQYLQAQVEKKLVETGLDLVSPRFVASQLVHSGMGAKDINGYNLDAIFNLDPVSLCERLACDALLYGTLKKWDRSYYAIQSVSSVSLELKLVSAKDKSELYDAVAEDADSRGITKIPTGFSDLVLEPIKGLSNDIIIAVANKVVDQALAPLMVSSRPEFLDASPPAIFASAHDAPYGQLSHSDYLTVLLFGTPEEKAYFSIGDKIMNIPMSEKQMGHYIGEYFPLSADSFSDLPVYVYLTDRFGKTSKQKIGTSNLTVAAQ